MLKKLVFSLVFLGAAVILFQQRDNLLKPKKEPKSEAKKVISAPTKIPKREVENKLSVFIPYWDVPTNFAQVAAYDRLIYFGITPTTSGINTTEQGYLKLAAFAQIAGPKEDYLTLRMTDSDQNFTILENLQLQDKIIQETISLAQKNGFDGIVLDLELFSLFSDKVESQITTFVKDFYEKARAENLKLALTIYGDVFHRRRPYELNSLAKNSDEIIIMAYDFHKSKGEPGPNFPFSDTKKYNYNFQKMIDDFTKIVPHQKLSVAFGMFGYDWLVDEAKRPIKEATAMSFLDIKKEFLTNCQWKNCLVLTDKKTKEKEVNYIDRTGGLHIVFFEDQESLEVKREYLKKYGIGNIIYWVYGYF
jgi:spore germination protein YaaH